MYEVTTATREVHPLTVVPCRANAPLLQTLRVQSRGPPGLFLETALTSLKYQAIFQAIGLNALE